MQWLQISRLAKSLAHGGPDEIKTEIYVPLAGSKQQF